MAEPTDQEKEEARKRYFEMMATAPVVRVEGADLESDGGEEWMQTMAKRKSVAKETVKGLIKPKKEEPK